jgi:hypothetical protein
MVKQPKTSMGIYQLKRLIFLHDFIPVRQHFSKYLFSTVTGTVLHSLLFLIVMFLNWGKFYRMGEMRTRRGDCYTLTSWLQFVQ